MIGFLQCEDLDLTKKIRAAEEDLKIKPAASGEIDPEANISSSIRARKTSEKEEPTTDSTAPKSLPAATPATTAMDADVENNPLATLLKNLMQTKFLVRGMNGSTIKMALQQYIVGQMDLQSQEQHTIFSEQQLQTIIHNIEDISMQDLEELAEAVISQYGNLLTEDPLTPDMLNDQFHELENDLTEEYKTARASLSQGILSGVTGNSLERMHKSTPQAPVTPATPKVPEARSMAGMVETMTTMYAAEAEHPHDHETHHGHEPPRGHRRGGRSRTSVAYLLYREFSIICIKSFIAHHQNLDKHI